MATNKYKFSRYIGNVVGAFILIASHMVSLHAQVIENEVEVVGPETDTEVYIQCCADEDEFIQMPLHIAVKTNLLYDAVFLPNLTVEWYIGKQWSLAAEGNWSWWKFDRRPIQNTWYHRIQAAGIELRRWFNSPYPLHGHAVGVYSMIGNYDLRLFVKDEHTQGYLSRRSWSAGLSYAYSFPIAHRLNLELGLAVGYMGGRYYRYDYDMTYNHWAQLGKYNRNYVGLTRVGVSIVWLPGIGNEKKSRNH